MILFFNPRASNTKPRIPNSILQIAATIDGKYEWAFVDGNLEEDPFGIIETYFKTGKYKYLAVTVMPGPQLKQAIPISKKIKLNHSNVKIIWGGYFPSNHSETVLNSGYIDVIVNGMGDQCFPEIINAFESNASFTGIKNIIYKEAEKIIKSAKDEIYDLDALNPFPYQKLNEYYPIRRYLGKTYLGTKTIGYHSSFGCPFTCSFCAVVPIYNARWKGKSPENIYKDIQYLKSNFNGNAIEFHDNNFFVSEKRVVEFSNLIMNENMIWWGEGRIDTIHKYKDETLALMRKAGCKMIFFGAETGSDKMLKKMDKGGTQSRSQILLFAERLKKFDIIPEYSMVLGFPSETEKEVKEIIDDEINFIREIKKVNPSTEIIIYVYSPVPTENSELYKSVLASGFSFPKNLEDWINHDWENFDLRKNPLTPWLKPYMIDKIKNFEVVLNGFYPTISDIRLNLRKRKFIRILSTLRYKLKIYDYPYEIKIFHKIWKYRQPEIEGF